MPLGVIDPLGVFTPEKLSGCLLSLRADKTYKDASRTQPTSRHGDDIAIWEDQSSYRTHLAASAATRPPLWMHGPPSIQFYTGVYFSVAWGKLTGNASRTMIARMKLAGTADCNMVSFGAFSGNALSQIAIYSGGIGYTGFGNDLTVSAAAYNDGNFHTVEVSFNGSTRTIYIDGVSVASDSTTLNTSSSALDIGRQIGGGGTFKGKLSHVIIYDRVLTAAERIQVTNYCSRSIEAKANPAANSAPADPTGIVPVILDMDMAGDIDDAAALNMAWTLHQRQECDVKCVVTNSAAYTSAPVVQAINDYFGHSSIPVGAYQASTPATLASGSYYGPTVTNQFRPGDNRTNYSSALTILRTALAAAVDGTVVICSTGYLNNLSDLLQSPADGISALTGLQLVTAKVRLLSMMGGTLPVSNTSPEYNIAGDPAGAAYVMINWPTDIVIADYVIGSTVFTKPSTLRDPALDPVKKTYDFTQGVGVTRESWDQLAVLYGVRGLSTYFSFAATGGSMFVNSTDGNNHWMAENGKVHYLAKVMSDANLVTALQSLYDATIIALSSIAAGSITSSGATITWTSSVAGDTVVEYGTTTAYGTSVTTANSVTSHSKALTGLASGTLYHYRVKTTDATGSLSVSSDKTFTTA